MKNEDIAAISTPPGEGGIAIIRLSGSEVIKKVNKIFQPCHTPRSLLDRDSHTLTLGYLKDDQNEVIDQVLVSIMKGPRSYTGEDVVEINTHGGNVAVKRCLEAVLQQGIRLAEPGEFTKRAFLNGRMDLSQAEAVVEVIRAKTARGLKLAINQLSGRNSQAINYIEEQLVAINAAINASLDFPDEVGEPDYREMHLILSNLIKTVKKIIAAGERAEIYRHGVNVVICGKPNVGKSSLLNLLLNKEKAIVTDVPGTTRDIIEDYISIKGIPVKLIDTAGIRATEDLVERIGIERSQQVIEEADIIIFLVDVGSGLTAEDRSIYDSIKHKNVIVLVNKEDLEEKNIDAEELKQQFPAVKLIRGSVVEEIGLEELEDSIKDMIISEEYEDESMEVMVTLRQKSILQAVLSSLEEALQGLNCIPTDCLGVVISEAIDLMGELTGKSLREEAIDRIFQDFCIGK